MGDDQRRTHHDRILHAAHHQALGDTDIPYHDSGLAAPAKTPVGPRFRDDFHRADQAQAARFAHQRMPGQFGQPLRQIRPGVFPGATDEILALDDLEILQRHGRRGGVAGIGIAMDEIIRVGLDRRDDEIGNPHRRNRQITR